MFNIIKKTINWGGSEITFETGKIARQADGAVIVTCGETVVMCTAVAAKTVKEGTDFFPLTVNYREMAFASGKIPGGYIKRETKASEREVLVSRLIDRPIRPLFPGNFYNELQVICTVLSYDGNFDPDILALIGASAALSIAGVPFQGPVAGARVGYANGEYLLNPLIMDNMDDHQLDLIVAGTESSVLMVESEAKELSEEIMLGAVEFGHKSFQPVIQAIKEFAAEAGKAVWWQSQEQNDSLYKEIKNLIGQDLVDAYGQMEKQVRSKKLEEAKNKALEHFANNEQVDSNEVKSAIKKIEQEFVRMRALDGKRIDGRGPADIRNITCEVGVLPRTHGSALFTRGETQALVVTTLGTSFDEQSFDSLYGEGKQHFLMHYNFPPYSVGEVSALRAPGRREIGHGKLAWRALNPSIPSKEAFPYTVRVVSEITESNGSSSMATVCGSSLAMMDAGVPLKSSIAGIAMGLIKEGDREVVLSDIMGDEDHLGDMDFKVAGSAEGVTALQMDIKINGISFETMKKALSQAKAGREHILSKMGEALTDSRKNVHKNAPVVTTVKINPDKIRDLIGTGGKVIRALCEETGAKIEIDDNGNVKIAAPNNDVCNHTISRINEITAELEIGKIYNGKIVKIVDFGLFVSALGGKEGMVHVSEIRPERVENPATLFSEGDEVKVKIIGIERGKVKMSMKYIDQETGEEKPKNNNSSSNNNASSNGSIATENKSAADGDDAANLASAAPQDSRPRNENRRSPGGADRKKDSYPSRGASKSRAPYEAREERRENPSSSPAKAGEEKRKYFN